MGLLGGSRACTRVVCNLLSAPQVMLTLQRVMKLQGILTLNLGQARSQLQLDEDRDVVSSTALALKHRAH